MGAPAWREGLFMRLRRLPKGKRAVRSAVSPSPSVRTTRSIALPVAALSRTGDGDLHPGGHYDSRSRRKENAHRIAPAENLHHADHANWRFAAHLPPLGGEGEERNARQADEEGEA